MTRAAGKTRIVMKFGGTSVADVDRIKAVAVRVKREVDAGHQVAVVVSAMSGTTNQLVGWTNAIARLHDAREYDAVVAVGRAGHGRPDGDRPAGASASARAPGSAGRSRSGPTTPMARPASGASRRTSSTGAWRWARCRWWRASRGWARTTASPRWAAAAPTPRRWRWPRRSRPIAATSSPMWTASTRPTRASLPRPASSIRSPTRRCSRWRPSAPRCCRSARSRWR